MDLVQLAIEVMVFVLLLYVAFLKSYFQEKGKNVATKEDISHITGLVESVKSKLQLSLQAKINLKREEHDAIVTYYAAYSSWWQSIANCSFSGIQYDTIGRLSELQLQLDELHHEAQTTLARVEVLVQNRELLVNARLLIAQTLDFHHHAQEKFPEYGLLCIEAERVKPTSQEPSEVERYRAALQAQVVFFGQFKDEQTETYKSLLPEVEKHRQQISTHLQAIAECG